MNNPVLVDGRNLFSPEVARAAGFRLCGHRTRLAHAARRHARRGGLSFSNGPRHRHRRPRGRGQEYYCARSRGTAWLLYIDTGAMYRAVAFWAIREHNRARRRSPAGTTGDNAISSLPQRRVLLNGEDVTRSDSKHGGFGRGIERGRYRRGRRRWWPSRSAWRRGQYCDGRARHRDGGFSRGAGQNFSRCRPAERVRRRAGEYAGVPTEALAAQIARTGRARPAAHRIPVDAGAGCDLSRFHGPDARRSRRKILKVVRARYRTGKRKCGHWLENLLVMKFGGTSVGSAERMKVACDLIA